MKHRAFCFVKKIVKPKGKHMIRSYSLLLIFIIIAISTSCKKEQDTGFDCDVQGISNVNAKVGDSKVIVISVNRTQGVAEDVELSLKNVPQGISYFFETAQGKPNFVTALTITVTNEIKLGKHPLTLEVKSANVLKTTDFEVIVDDSVTMQMKVYDGTKWSPDSPAGELCDSAKVKLFTDSAAFVRNAPCYTTYTDQNGIASFYHLSAGAYLFTVEKGALSNIVSKIKVNGSLLGFATTNIDKYGQFQYRDENGDGKITALDRVAYDMLILYEGYFSQRVVWIGR